MELNSSKLQGGVCLAGTPSSFILHHGDAMKNSFALVTGTTSGLGYAAAGLLAAKGYKQVIVTGRRLGAGQQTAAQLAAETKKNIFTPLELDLDSPSSVHSALDD